ncbi:MAG: endonuclease/exonuclease/phosphatase family protein [Bacteroidaceae bacterium]|nr:endonuclease/exonuclease/phosphatase family protein [Bacteroidaceae bacterium]
MPRLLCYIFACVICASAACQILTVGSYNIRYRNSDDMRNGNGWERRCKSICKQIKWEHPDIFGAQEVLHQQLSDMAAELDGYDWIGVGRDDGDSKGEYAPIFYDSRRLRLVEKGHFWLNETPERPKLGWDAACIRICTWGHFEDIETGKDFYYLNLHMDHVGVKARSESAKLVMRRISEMTCGGEKTAVLTGDFNVSQEDSLYALFTRQGLLKDSYECAKERWAENGTYNAFKTDRFTSERIDHILVTKSVEVIAYAVRTDSYWLKDDKGKVSRRNPSDHYPIFARIQL